MQRSPKGTIKLCLMGQEMGVYTPWVGTKLPLTHQSWKHVGVFNANTSCPMEKKNGTLKKQNAASVIKERKEIWTDLILLDLLWKEAPAKPDLSAVYEECVFNPVCVCPFEWVHPLLCVCVQLGWGLILLFHSSRVTNRINSGLPTEQGDTLAALFKESITGDGSATDPIVHCCARIHAKEKKNITWPVNLEENSILQQLI